MGSRLLQETQEVTPPDSLTYDLLVSAIFSRTNVDEVKQCLAPREAAHKFLKLDDILVDSLANQYVAKAPHVCVYAAHDAGPERNVMTLVFDVFLDVGEQLRGSPAATLFAFAKVFVTKLSL
jgi:hypothetical protein